MLTRRERKGCAPRFRVTAVTNRNKPGPWKSWVAHLCVLLVLMFTAIEATHAHSGSSISAGSAGCAICVSVHANAPAVAHYCLLTTIAVEFLPSPYQTEGKDFARELSLFIRPPPLTWAVRTGLLTFDPRSTDS
jgi:hypothetical protein